MQPRWQGVTGFSLRELVTIAAERPFEVVVVGSAKRTLQRLALTTVLPEPALRPRIDFETLEKEKQRGRCLPLEACYAINYVTSLPFIANIVLDDASRVHARAPIIAPRSVAAAAENSD